jgi:predicted metallopeptidase
MSASTSTKLSLAEMRQLVLQELDHIPRWPKGSQSDLRGLYWFWRMNSLGKKAVLDNDRSAVMQKCLDDLAKRHPGVEFLYDQTFFHIPSRE